MNNWKRGLAALLTAVLLITGCVSSAFAAEPAFRDVPANHWAKTEIYDAVKAGLVQGVSATEFGLGRTMTRAAFTVVLCRFFGWTLQNPAHGSFADSDPAAWYYSAVETACAHGALSRAETNFRPADPITREEMAVMLVRALGCTTLAGLDQGIVCPFSDVTTNRGYLTMAYYLGISEGTGNGQFSPDRTATREQAVVMLMRLYRRATATLTDRIALVASDTVIPDLQGVNTAVLTGARLLPNGTASFQPDNAAADTFLTACRKAKASALLAVSGSESNLQTKTAQSIVDAAIGYDGVLLDIGDMTERGADRLTALVQELRQLLGKRKLYVTAQAPASSGAANGYDCAALAVYADRLILRTGAYQLTSGTMHVLPQEPQEEIYYAMAVLRGKVDPAKCSLWITADGLQQTSRRGTPSAVTAGTIRQLISDLQTTVYYSDRYAEAYLLWPDAPSRPSVWYHDSRAVAARFRMASLMGMQSVCLSSLATVDPLIW